MTRYLGTVVFFTTEVIFLNFILLCIFEAGSSSLLPPPGMESYFLSHRSSEATPASEHPYYSTIQSTKKQYVCLNSQYS